MTPSLAVGAQCSDAMQNEATENTALMAAQRVQLSPTRQPAQCSGNTMPLAGPAADGETKEATPDTAPMAA